MSQWYNRRYQNILNANTGMSKKVKIQPISTNQVIQNPSPKLMLSSIADTLWQCNQPIEENKREHNILNDI